MLKIVDERGSGKTSLLCQYALDNECDIIVPNHSNVKHVLEELRYQANRYRYEILDAKINALHGDAMLEYVYKDGSTKTIFIFSVDNVSVGYVGQKHRPRKVVVDEVERCMAMLLYTYGCSYQGFTMGLEE